MKCKVTQWYQSVHSIIFSSNFILIFFTNTLNPRFLVHGLKWLPVFGTSYALFFEWLYIFVIYYFVELVQVYYIHNRNIFSNSSFRVYLKPKLCPSAKKRRCPRLWLKIYPAKIIIRAYISIMTVIDLNEIHITIYYKYRNPL